MNIKHRKTTATDRITVKEGVSAREFDGEWVLLDLSGGNYFGLDALGGTIWAHLCAGLSSEQIAELLAKTYEAPKGTILADVLSLVQTLVENGLVQITEDGS